MRTIEEYADIPLVKFITKSAKLNIDNATNYNWSFGDDYKKCKVATFLAGCNAIIRGKQNRLDEILKYARYLGQTDNIIKFAKQYSVLNEEKRKQAKLELKGVRPRKDAALNIVKKAVYADSKYYPYYHALSKLACVANTTEDMLKVAERVGYLDKLSGVATRDTENLSEQLFEEDIKEEKPKRVISYDIIVKALGEKIAEALFKDGVFQEKIYETLPKPQKDMVEKYLQNEGGETSE